MRSSFCLILRVSFHVRCFHTTLSMTRAPSHFVCGDGGVQGPLSLPSTGLSFRRSSDFYETLGPVTMTVGAEANSVSNPCRTRRNLDSQYPLRLLPRVCRNCRNRQLQPAPGLHLPLYLFNLQHQKVMTPLHSHF